MPHKSGLAPLNPNNNSSTPCKSYCPHHHILPHFLAYLLKPRGLFPSKQNRMHCLKSNEKELLMILICFQLSTFFTSCTLRILTLCPQNKTMTVNILRLFSAAPSESFPPWESHLHHFLLAPLLFLLVNFW